MFYLSTIFAFAIACVSACFTRSSDADKPFYSVDMSNSRLTTRQRQCESDSSRVWKNQHCVYKSKPCKPKEHWNDALGFCEGLKLEPCFVGSLPCDVAQLKKNCDESNDMEWDGGRCIDKASQPNFYRLCMSPFLATDLRVTVSAILKTVKSNDCQESYLELLRQKTLLIGGNQLKNLEPLRGLEHFEALHAPDNSIQDISILSGFLNLQKLDLSHNLVENIEPLSNLFQIHSLSLMGNPIKSLESLDQLPNLTDLDISSTFLDILDPLQQGVVCSAVAPALLKLCKS